jgi:hypothetical protein
MFHVVKLPRRSWRLEHNQCRSPFNLANGIARYRKSTSTRRARLQLLSLCGQRSPLGSAVNAYIGKYIIFIYCAFTIMLGLRMGIIGIIVVDTGRRNFSD